MDNQRGPPEAEAPAIPGGRQLPNRQLSSTAQSRLTDNSQKVQDLFFLKKLKFFDSYIPLFFWLINLLWKMKQNGTLGNIL